MHSFDTTIQLAAIRQDELRHAAARGHVARITRRSRLVVRPARGGCTSITAVAIPSDVPHRPHTPVPGMF